MKMLFSSSSSSACFLSSATLLFLLLLLSIAGITIGAEYRIESENDFYTFVNSVNTEKETYSGTTVFLDSDLSLSEAIEPIGKNSSTYYQFRGTFDGQGYIISNLKVNTSSSLYAGLFGHSGGLTIRNVVLDSSCSMTNTYNESVYVFVGGIVGYCRSEYSDCIIENSVNMASVVFSGNNADYSNLYLGGIIGNLYSYPSSNYKLYVKNCANYGSVTHSGIIYFVYIGGVAGYLTNSGPKNYRYIYNCLNHGTITHNGTTSVTLYIGGIAGNSCYMYIENCVSAGKIALSTTGKSNYIGSLVGKDDSHTSINYCYYIDELSNYNVYGGGTPTIGSSVHNYDNTTFELPENVSIGGYTANSLIDILNGAADHYAVRDYSHWLLNKQNKGVSFTVSNRGNPIEMDHQVILLPSLASEGNVSFDGWYTDSGHKTPLTSQEVTEEETTLYGKFEENPNKYTVTLLSRRAGVSFDSVSAQFGSPVSLPSDSAREGCSVGHWENEFGDVVGLSFTMPARNTTLYAVWKCTHINTPEDFFDFSKIVNSGTDDFNGTTVFLDSDLSLSEKAFEPIGKDTSFYFQGAFDGQGYAISDLTINVSSSVEYAGLFGYSQGLTLKSVVLDSSCSVASSYGGSSSLYMGGLIGSCYGSNGDFNIENCVNMGSITFDGNIRGNNYRLFIGGIVGYLLSSSPKHTCIIKNCANYGLVTHSGTVGSKSYMGGIVGHLYGGQYIKYLYNCLNYGAIIHNGTSSNAIYMGGIAGYSYYTYIENCVSAGRITTNKQSDYIGSIIGYGNLYTNITHCFWASDVEYNAYGAGTPSIDVETSKVDLNADFIRKLNNYSANNSWNKWLLNTNNDTVTIKVNNNSKGFSLISQIILLFDLADEWRLSIWFTDSACTTLLPSSNCITEGTTLYRRWDRYTITYDANEGAVDITTKNVTYGGIYGELPTPTRTEHAFIGWFTDKNESVTNETTVKIANDHTLHAHWRVNNYTVTFVFDNGDADDVRTVEFNSTFSYPINPAKEGYLFNGWDNERVEFMPAGNLTITAQWIVNNYTLTFVFDNGDADDVRTVEFNSTFSYPINPAKEGYSFNGWDNETIKFMPARNITITARWIPNNYTVTFNLSEGNADITFKNVTFNNTYGELPKPTREGYVFIGWFTDKNESITSETTVNIADDHTLHAQWEKATNQVEITFNTKDLTEEEIEKIVSEYTDGKFTVTILEDDLEEMKVIIKFTDVEKAEEFVRNIKTSNDKVLINRIKKVSFNTEGAYSLSSSTLCHIFFFVILIL